MRIKAFLEDSPLFNLALAYDEIIGDFQKRLRAEGVHFLQALVLTGIYFEKKPVRPRELAKIFSVKKSNLSHALRGLERQGLIERQTLESDARAYLFSLTKEARRTVPRLVKLFDSTEKQIEAAFAGRRVSPGLKHFRRIYRRVS